MDTARVKPWKTAEVALQFQPDGDSEVNRRISIPRPQDRSMVRILHYLLGMFSMRAVFVAVMLLFCLPQFSFSQDPLDELIQKSERFLERNRDSALHYANSAVEIAEFEERDIMVARALKVRGRAKLKLKLYADAKRDFKRSHYLFLASGNRSGVASNLLWLGQTCEIQVRLDSALAYFDSALVSLRVISADQEIAMTHIRVGKVYERSGERLEARKAYLEALRVAENASLVFEIGMANQRLGLLFLDMGKYLLAERDLMAALKRFKSLGNETEMARTYHGLGIVNMARQKYEDAGEYAKMGLDLARDVGSRALTMDFYQFMGDLHAEMGNYERAYDYRRLNDVIRDSLLGDATARQLSELVSQYEQDKLQLENEKNAQEIALQNVTLKLQKQEIKSQNTRFFVILGGLIAFFLFAIVLTYAIVQKNRTNRKLNIALDDLRLAQDQLVRAEKLASLGQVTAGIAHEIRNPLNFVNSLSKLSVGMVDELAEELMELKGKQFDAKSAELIFEYFSDIRANTSKVLQHGERATRIVKDMLQHATVGSQEKQAEDLNSMVQEYLQVAFHAARSQNEKVDYVLDFDPAKELPQPNVVRSDLGRAFLNIFGNAFEAMEFKWGKESDQYEPKISVLTRRRGNKIEIIISDNGPGISEEHLEKVFEPFFTTKPPNKGTGLGLSLAYETIVQSHGGKLEVESTPGHGTTMRIEIPI